MKAPQVLWGAFWIVCKSILNADEAFPRFKCTGNCVHEQAAKLGPISRAAGMEVRMFVLLEGQIYAA